MTQPNIIKDIVKVLTEHKDDNAFNALVAGETDITVSKSQATLNAAYLEAIKTGIHPSSKTKAAGLEKKIQALLNSYSNEFKPATVRYLETLKSNITIVDTLGKVIEQAHKGELPTEKFDWRNDSEDKHNNEVDDEGDYSVDNPIVEKVVIITDSTMNVLEHLNPEKPVKVINEQAQKTAATSKRVYGTSLGFIKTKKSQVATTVKRVKQVAKKASQTITHEWKQSSPSSQ